MPISLLTYNLLYNRALNNIDKVIKEYHPDIIVLQEIETSEENLSKIESLNYRLADYSNSFFKHQKIYGIATFYNPKTLHLKKSESFNLPRGLYEIFLFILRGGNNPRTLLKTEFSSLSNNKEFVVNNLHLTTWGTNKLRMKQIKETFQTLDINGKPNIIAGDFNYPYGRKKFETLFQNYNLKEATHNIINTFETKFLKFFTIKLKLDYILYQHLELIGAKKIDVRFSDHYPILITFDL